MMTSNSSKNKKGLFVERKQRSGKNSSKKKYIILEWLQYYHNKLILNPKSLSF